MEVRKSFPKQVKALAESTPREAIANLLSALMPRVAVQTKAPQPYTTPDWATEYPAPGGPDPMAKLTKKRAPRTRTANKSYAVLMPHAYTGHRRQSWRGRMVEAVVLNQDEASAMAWLQEKWPAYAAKGIDFAWCAAQGYIRYH